MTRIHRGSYEQLGKVRGFRLYDAAAREAADVADDRCHPVDARGGLFEEHVPLFECRLHERTAGGLRECGAGIVPVLLQEPDVRSDVGERIVDLVRDSGGELAEGRQALRGDQAASQRHEFAQVAYRKDVADAVPLVIQQRAA